VDCRGIHKVANILDALPKSIQPLAKKMLTEFRDAEDEEHAREAAKAFDAEFRTKWPKAADKLSDDLEVLLRFYDYPAEHWLHLKTSNPIESTFSTVRLRTKVTKGLGSRAAGLAMAFKLIEAAEDRWRYVNGAHLVALVRAGATFRKGRWSRATRRKGRSPRDQRVGPSTSLDYSSRGCPPRSHTTPRPGAGGRPGRRNDSPLRTCVAAATTTDRTIRANRVTIENPHALKLSAMAASLTSSR
jgi:hypothetical protein